MHLACLVYNLSDSVDLWHLLVAEMHIACCLDAKQKSIGTDWTHNGRSRQYYVTEMRL